MIICTIGFSKKSLREFVSKLQGAGVKKIIDIRLNNTSQLAGYAKKQDLEYVLELVGIEYEHRPEFAPTAELMKDYQQKQVDWDAFEQIFKSLLDQRNPLESFDLRQQPDIICLLCAEDKPVRCHRRLVAEYMQGHGEGIDVKHL
ncbi:MAG: DUF488 domain-containing protein [Syntrophomonadaceae bacterium]